MLRYFIVLFLLLIPRGPLQALTRECATALKELFAQEISAEEAGDFLHLQGQLTLHRLAWTYLKAQQEDSDQRVSTVEKTILDLLDQKYTSSDPDFVKAREAFEAQPLSRTALAEIAPYLKEAMAAGYDEKDLPFRLNTSDLKLLSTLARFEKATAKNGKYDHRMLNAKSPRGMLNFVKLVNSGYKLDTTKEEESLRIEANLAGLENLIRQMEGRIAEFLKDLSIPLECQTEDACTTESEDMADFFTASDEVQQIFWDALAPSLENDDILFQRLTYGEIWLQVKYKTQSEALPVVKKTTTRTKNYSKNIPKANPGMKPTPPALVSDVGLLIEDPVGIIVRDQPGRKADGWKKFDRSYLQAMAQAILADDKVFELKGKLYDRKTGREVSVDKALEKIPPKRRAELKNYISKDPKIRTSQVRAMVNGDQAFMVGSKLYNLKGVALDPTKVIANEMTKKFSVTVSSDRYKGMGQDYLRARALALRNGKPYFKHQGKVMDSYTGRGISSPFRSTAGQRDVKLEKERRRMYEGLSDGELIRNYHRDFPNPQCGHYAIIDKRQAKLRVFANNGQQVFEAETLLGTEGRDTRTRWTDYKNRQASQTTGAGEYTIKKQNLNDSYNKQQFNNNIISFEGQNMVFAIHQVPVGAKERYTRFGTGDSSDRRGTGGCANLKVDDLLKVRKWLKPQCKVYVLPEEPQNRFVVKDNKLQFISSEPVNTKEEKFYNYTPANPSTPRPIEITFNTQPTKLKGENNIISRPFVKSLEKEKAKLMGLYGLTNEEYNDLAMLAFGIMGNESDFGRSVKLWGKETNQPLVILSKFGKELWEDGEVKKEDLKTSRGYTQIKYLPEGKFKKAYPHITPGTLMKPENAAVATVAYLAEAMHTLKRLTSKKGENAAKVRVSREKMIDYLPYIYMGSAWRLKAEDLKQRADPDTNTYIQGVRRNMSLIEIKEKF